MTPSPPTVSGRYCPACNRAGGRLFKPGPRGRPDATCPYCRSLERHRFLALLLPCLAPGLAGRELLLDVAPSPQVTPLLARLGMRRHVRLDLGADNRLVDVLGSLTDLPLADDSADLIVCYHVLEHIPDDRRAMRELARVLRPGGLAVLQVPWRPGTRTDEDPSAPEDVRLARFGQADHVRYYGDDFEDRLVEAGFTLRRVTPGELVGEAACGLFKLVPHETVWLAAVSSDPHLPLAGVREPTSLTRTFDHLIAELDTHRRAAARAQARVAVLERRLAPVTKLARYLPPRVKARVRRLGTGPRP